jgi:hypothetical protein
MRFLLTLLAVPLAAGAGLAFKAWLWRVRGAHVRITPDFRSISSELGSFTYDKARGILRFTRDGAPPRDLPIGPSARLLSLPDIEPALLTEFLSSLVGVGDFGITDLMPRYRDYRKTITLVLDDGERRVPLAMFSQYRAVDAGDGTGIGGNDMTRAVLTSLRLYRDLDACAEAWEFLIADALRKQGLNVA